MRIGQTAVALGIPAHVLRHWDDEGVVVPDRSATGHRLYSEEHLGRCRIVRSCQSVGMSLAEIRVVLDRRAADRNAILGARLGQIRRQRQELAAAEAFLVHVRECTHDLMTRCPGCASYAEG